MFACFLLCRPLPFRQRTCLPGAPRRGPQNRPFWSPGKHVRLFPALSPVALSTANLPARRPKKRSSESSVLAPRAPPNPKRHPKIPWGEPKNSQTAPRGPQGAPLEPQRTTRDHRGTARELPRNPPGPQGPQESPSFFPPSFLLPPSSLFLPPFLLPPPSFLPSLCKFLPTTSGQPVCAPTLAIPTGGRRHRAPALKISAAPTVVLYIIGREGPSTDSLSRLTDSVSRLEGQKLSRLSPSTGVHR